MLKLQQITASELYGIALALSTISLWILRNKQIGCLILLDTEAFSKKKKKKNNSQKKITTV